MTQETNIKLTIPQLVWLHHILTRGFDGYFEGNPRERKLCDNVADRVEGVLDEVGIKYNFPYTEKSGKKLEEELKKQKKKK